jgi:CRP/FNR family transcriptional regulator
LPPALLQFADKYGTPHPEGTLIRMPLSREGLAGYIGMARETVSRKLGQLETDGLLRSLSARQLLLTDLAGITALAETESPE